VVEVEDNVDENRLQATVKICGHKIFDTEDHELKEPKIVVVDSLTALAEHTMASAKEFAALEKYEIMKVARASVALNGQTQSNQNVEE